MNIDNDIIERATRILRKGGTSYDIDRKMQQIDQLYRKEYRELLTLIQSDLRMRADEEGVVNISNFIWQRIKQELSDD